jgi:phenylacetate-CoA ligase
VLATSGTTGDRMFVAYDEDDWRRFGDWREATGLRAGLGRADVLLNTHCYGLWVGGPALDQLAQRCGAGLVPLGPTSPAVVLGLLADGVGSAISATPSYLRRLIETAEADCVDLRRSGLRVGFIGAEQAEQALRSKLLERLPEDFHWVELYGLTETGGPCVAAGPDPERPELEYNVADFHVEVLAADDVPVGPDEVGELTLTTRRPSCRTPLIRYRTRDLVRVTAGHGGDVLRTSRILGRADDAMKIGGVLMYPSSVAEIVTAVLPTSAEWRAIVQRHGDDYELLIEAETGAADCARLERVFQDRMGLGITAVAIDGDVLDRSRHKTQRIVVDSSTGHTRS